MFDSIASNLPIMNQTYDTLILLDTVFSIAWGNIVEGFLKNTGQINKTNYATMLFMSKQASLLKVSLTLEKIKIDPKCFIHPFCTKASYSAMLSHGIPWSIIYPVQACVLLRKYEWLVEYPGLDFRKKTLGPAGP